MARDERMIAALKRERAAYLAADRPERAAEVDAELAKLDARSDADVQAPARTAGDKAPRGRRGKPQNDA